MAGDVTARRKTERELLTSAQSRGFGSTLAAYDRLSGPGWLQSAITLGGGSLASSLYLGVLAGFSLMWLHMRHIGAVDHEAVGNLNSCATIQTQKEPNTYRMQLDESP